MERANNRIGSKIESREGSKQITSNKTNVIRETKTSRLRAASIVSPNGEFMRCLLFYFMAKKNSGRPEIRKNLEEIMKEIKHNLFLSENLLTIDSHIKHLLKF